MSCNCDTCREADEERAEKLVKLGHWLVNREGKNGATTTSMLIRKLRKIGVLDGELNHE